MKRIALFGLLFTLYLVGCETPAPEKALNWEQEAKQANFLHRSMKKLSDVIVHDIFSPPVASRNYAYSSIAGYEALRHAYPDYQSLAGQLNGLTALPQPESGQQYCFPLASVHAFLQVGKNLIFSEEKMEVFRDSLYDEFRALGVPSSVFDRSIAYGDAVAAHIMEWSSKDNYKETRSYPKYTVPTEDEKWKPTPPDYMDGIEPHWREIRTFVLQDPDQFTPPPPTAYDMEQGSQFYQELMEVYQALEADDKEERLEIARFWDCNPYVSTHVGHVMFATKKITPGGHWIGITGLACKKAGADMMESARAYAMVSIALADAFISCWDEKYRSNLVRPETVINLHVDENWRPALQTPPFPEYTSGHSVISRAAAITLTHIFGDNFAFNDTVEEEYGLPARSFDSFLQASEEAAISRLYGGIHYRPAIDNGVAQGEKVGKYIIGQVTTKDTSVGMK